MRLYRAAGKRLLDISIASLMLVLLSPLLLVLALLVRVKLGAPILYRQERTGFGRRPFEIIKFRTMLQANAEDGTPLPDDQRLTRFGNFLRNWSLDELPSLWNILRGDMGAVGPRPFIHDYDELYTDEQARRFEVRPGVTGWAQVRGRNSISWEEKFALDVWYVDHITFRRDLQILWETVISVMTRRDINAGDAPTMSRFLGTSRSNQYAEGPDSPL